MLESRKIPAERVSAHYALEVECVTQTAIPKLVLSVARTFQDEGVGSIRRKGVALGERMVDEDRPFDVTARHGGPGADTVQERLVDGLERLGIVVFAVYDGGPEPLRTIGAASDGKWMTSADLPG